MQSERGVRRSLFIGSNKRFYDRDIQVRQPEPGGI